MPSRLRAYCPEPEIRSLGYSCGCSKVASKAIEGRNLSYEKLWRACGPVTVLERAGRNLIGGAREQVLGRELASGHTADTRQRRRGGCFSFDDGPTYATTPDLIAVLRFYEATATFFVTGEPATRAPDLLEALVNTGHVSSPMDGDTSATIPFDPRILIDDLDRVESLLRRARPTPSPYLVRLPYGAGHTAGACIGITRMEARRSDCRLGLLRPGLDAR